MNRAQAHSEAERAQRRVVASSLRPADGRTLGNQPDSQVNAKPLGSGMSRGAAAMASIVWPLVSEE